MSDTNKDTPDLTELQAKRPSWWRLPFDPTTNFSLLGYFMAGCRWADPRKRTDFTMKDE